GGLESAYLQVTVVDGNGDPTEAVIYVGTASKRTFTNGTGSPVRTFDAPVDFTATLEAEAITDSKDYDNDGSYTDTILIFRLTQIDSGDIYIFCGHDGNTAVPSQGQLVERTNRAWYDLGK